MAMRVSLANPVDKKIEKWNSEHDIGAEVSVMLGRKSVELKTRSEAFRDGLTAAIYLEGVSGMFSLDHVLPINELRGDL